MQTTIKNNEKKKRTAALEIILSWHAARNDHLTRFRGKFYTRVSNDNRDLLLEKPT